MNDDIAREDFDPAGLLAQYHALPRSDRWSQGPELLTHAAELAAARADVVLQAEAILLHAELTSPPPGILPGIDPLFSRDSDASCFSLFESACELAERAPGLDLLYRANFGLAEALSNTLRYEEALSRYKKAVEVAHLGDDPSRELAARLRRTHLHLFVDAPVTEDLVEELRDSAALAERLAEPCADIWRLAAERSWCIGDRPAAKTMFRHAIDVTRPTEAPGQVKALLAFLDGIDAGATLRGSSWLRNDYGNQHTVDKESRTFLLDLANEVSGRCELEWQTLVSLARHEWVSEAPAEALTHFRSALERTPERDRERYAAQLLAVAEELGRRNGHASALVALALEADPAALARRALRRARESRPGGNGPFVATEEVVTGYVEAEQLAANLSPRLSFEILKSIGHDMWESGHDERALALFARAALNASHLPLEERQKFGQGLLRPFRHGGVPTDERFVPALTALAVQVDPAALARQALSEARRLERATTPKATTEQVAAQYADAERLVADPDSSLLFDILESWSRYLRSAGRIEDALPVFGRAARVAEEAAVTPARHFGIHSNWGYSLRDLGGHADEVASTFRRAADLAAEAGLQKEECWTRQKLGEALQAAGCHEESLPCFERALVLATHLKLEREQGWAWEFIGRAHRSLGSPKKAVQAFTRAATLLRRHDSTRELDIRMNCGYSLRELGRRERATSQFRRAANLAASAGLQVDECSARQKLGEELRAAGHHEKSLASFDRALTLATELMLEREQGWALEYRGDSLRSLGRHTEAVQAYLRAEPLVRRNDPPREWAIRMSCGYSLRDLGRHEESLKQFAAAESVARAVQNVEREARSSEYRGHALSSLSRHAEAVDAFARAASLAKEANESRLSVIYRTWGDSLRQLGVADDAVAKSALAIEAARAAGDRSEECWAQDGLGNTLRKFDRHEEALAPLTRAAHLAAEFKPTPTFELSTRRMLARSLRELGRLDHASRELARCRRLAKACGDIEERLWVEADSAELGRQQGRLSRARMYFRRAAKLADDGAMPGEAALMLAKAARVSLELGDVASGKAFLQQAENKARHSGDVMVTVQVLIEEGIGVLPADGLDAALNHFDEALRTAADLTNEEQAEARLDIASVLAGIGAHEAALKLTLAAAGLAATPSAEIRASWMTGVCLFALGRHGECWTEMDSTLSRFTEVTDEGRSDPALILFMAAVLASYTEILEGTWFAGRAALLRDQIKATMQRAVSSLPADTRFDWLGRFRLARALDVSGEREAACDLYATLSASPDLRPGTRAEVALCHSVSLLALNRWEEVVSAAAVAESAAVAVGNARVAAGAAYFAAAAMYECDLDEQAAQTCRRALSFMEGDATNLALRLGCISLAARADYFAGHGSWAVSALQLIAEIDTARQRVPVPLARRGLLDMFADDVTFVCRVAAAGAHDELCWRAEQTLKARTFEDEVRMLPILKEVLERAPRLLAAQARLEDSLRLQDPVTQSLSPARLRAGLRGGVELAPMAPPQILETTQAEAEAEFEQAWQEVVFDYPQLAAVETLPPPELADLRAALGSGETYEGFVWDDNAMVQLSVEPGAGLTVTLWDGESFRSLKTAVEEARNSRATTGAWDANALGRIGGALLRPNATTTLVSPHGPLASLPLQLLMPDRAISVVPSAATFLRLRGTAHGERRLPYVGIACNPGDIPGVEMEVARIAARLPRSRTFTNRPAAEVAVVDERVGLLHYAVHAGVDGLRLEPGDWHGPSRFLALGTACDILLCTGCNAGAFGAEATNEFLGVIRQLMIVTQARAAIVSLEPVPDAAGVVFADSFVAALAGQQPEWLVDWEPSGPMPVGEAVARVRTAMQSLQRDDVSDLVLELAQSSRVEGSSVRGDHRSSLVPDESWWQPWYVIGDPAVSLKV